MRLFHEVMIFEQALVQQIVSTADEAYLADVRNRMTYSTNNTVAGFITNLQENYSQLMPHELLEREETVKETTYHPRDFIATVFTTVE